MEKMILPEYLVSMVEGDYTWKDSAEKFIYIYIWK